MDQSRGPGVVQAVNDVTVKTVQQTADLTVQMGSRLYTDSASRDRALKGYVDAEVSADRVPGFEQLMALGRMA
jgi:hypothetical protein